MLIIFARVTAVAMVYYPCIQNIMTIMLFNKKTNFIIEHNGISSIIVATILKYTHFFFFLNERLFVCLCFQSQDGAPSR